MSRIALVVAVSRNGVIGRAGGLPWQMSSDMQRFKATTLGMPVIMGRKTWESLPRKPLPGRVNIVVTRNPGYDASGALVVTGVNEALAAAGNVDEVCVIGGGDIYARFLPHADRIYLSEIDAVVDGDTFFPRLDPAEWRETSREHVPQGPKDSAAFDLRVLDRVRQD